MAFPPNLLRTLATDVVNNITQLNNNWDIIDTAFSSLWGSTLTVPSVTNPIAGVEWINRSGSLQIFDGTAWNPPQVETWGAWTTVNITAAGGYTVRPGFPIQIRVSSFKNVEMQGCILAPAGGFPDAGYILINSGQFTATYLPESNMEVFPAARDIVTGAGAFALGYVYVTTASGSLNIYILPEGTRNSSNYISFCNVRYKAQ